MKNPSIDIAWFAKHYQMNSDWIYDRSKCSNKIDIREYKSFVKSLVDSYESFVAIPPYKKFVDEFCSYTKSRIGNDIEAAAFMQTIEDAKVYMLKFTYGDEEESNVTEYIESLKARIDELETALEEATATETETAITTETEATTKPVTETKPATQTETTTTTAEADETKGETTMKNHNISIEDFAVRYRKNYDWLYEGGDQISEYDDLVKSFDAFANAHQEFVAEFCNYMQDLISSDREAAAFMLTLTDMTDDEDDRIPAPAEKPAISTTISEGCTATVSAAGNLIMETRYLNLDDTPVEPEDSETKGATTMKTTTKTTAKRPSKTIYTAALKEIAKSALKKTGVPHETIVAQKIDGSVYVTNGYGVYKLTPAEYNYFILPVTKTAATETAYRITAGETDEYRGEPLNEYFAREATAGIRVYPVHATFGDNQDRPIGAAVSADGAKSIYYQPYLFNVIDRHMVYRYTMTKDTSPLVIWDTPSAPIAVILPIRPESIPYSIGAAVKTLAPDYKPEPDTESLKAQLAGMTEVTETFRNRIEELEHTVDSLYAQANMNAKNNQQERDAAAARIAELEAALAAATQTKPETKPEAVTETEPATETVTTETAPATALNMGTTVDEAEAALKALEGVTVTVKGRKTAMPVIWISGDTKQHKEALKAAGCKWSAKKGAWWYKTASC